MHELSGALVNLDGSNGFLRGAHDPLIKLGGFSCNRDPYQSLVGSL